MSTRQYIGARYVPKFFDNNGDSTWVENTAYEALTIVTYNNASYTSKIPVPASVSNPADNSEYWVLTGNYNGQVAGYAEVFQELYNNTNEKITNFTDTYEKIDTKLKYVLDPSESDNVAETIMSALATYDEVSLTPGEYNVTEAIIIPNGKVLDGNNSTLIASSDFGSEDYVVYVGDSTVYGSTNINLYGNHSQILKNIVINCNNVCNGVKIVAHRCALSDVKIIDVIDYGTGVYVAKNNSSSSDADLRRVDVQKQSGIIKYGFYVEGLDNVFDTCRTFHTIYGFYGKMNGCSFSNCHPLAFTSDGTYADDWLNSAGWYHTGTSTLHFSNCYADNFRYGFYSSSGGTFDGTFRMTHWETGNSAQRYAAFGETYINPYADISASSSSVNLGYRNGNLKSINSVENLYVAKTDIAHWIRANINYHEPDTIRANDVGWFVSSGNTNWYEILGNLDGRAYVDETYGTLIAYLPRLYTTSGPTSATITNLNLMEVMTNWGQFKIGIRRTPSTGYEEIFLIESCVFDSAADETVITAVDNSEGDCLVFVKGDGYERVYDVTHHSGLALALPRWNVGKSTLNLIPDTDSFTLSQVTLSYT